MDFDKIKSLLEALRERTPEFIATGVVDVETGEPLVELGGAWGFNIKVASEAYAEVIKANSRALGAMGLENVGKTYEIIIINEKTCILLRLLEDKWYHGLAITTRGNLGLCRKLMKELAPQLVSALKA